MTGLSLATPLLLCALGGAICSKSGNFNIALEGFMLIGAFFGVVGSHFFNSVAVGVSFAIGAANGAVISSNVIEGIGNGYGVFMGL